MFSLRRIVNMCEEHVREAVILFSTDLVIPEKSKTMCIAFGTRDDAILSKVSLKGDTLLWKD